MFTCRNVNLIQIHASSLKKKKKPYSFDYSYSFCSRARTAHMKVHSMPIFPMAFSFFQNSGSQWVVESENLTYDLRVKNINHKGISQVLHYNRMETDFQEQDEKITQDHRVGNK